MSERKFIAIQATRSGVDRVLPTFLRIDDISAVSLNEPSGCTVELRNGAIYSIEEKHAADLLALIGQGAG